MALAAPQALRNLVSPIIVMISNWFPLTVSSVSTVATVADRVGFDEIKRLNTAKSNDLLINTLPEHMQQCLISNTTSIQDEITQINDFLENRNWNACIYIYGMNHRDPTVERKQKQLKQLGFKRVSVYLGGLFEWLLLQDVYGKTEFPTTSVQTDILQYKP